MLDYSSPPKRQWLLDLNHVRACCCPRINCTYGYDNMLKHTNTHTHTHTHTYTHTCFQVSRYTTSSYSGIDRTEDDAWAFNLGVVRGSDQRTTICFSSPIAEEEQTPSENGRRSLSQGACSSSHTHTHTMWRRSVCKRADSKLGALHCKCIQSHALATHLSLHTAHVTLQCLQAR